MPPYPAAMVRATFLLALVGGLVGFAIGRRPAEVVIDADLAASLADAAAAARRGDDDACWLMVHVRHRDRAASPALDAWLASDRGLATLRDGLGSAHWRHVRVDLATLEETAPARAAITRLAGAATAVTTLILRGEELVGRLDGCPTTEEWREFLATATASRPRFDRWAAVLAQGDDDAADGARRLDWIEQLFLMNALDRAEALLAPALAPAAAPLPPDVHRRALDLEITLLERRGQLERAAAARIARDRRYPPAPSASDDDPMSTASDSR
jgi:hypothetical protein